VPIDLIYADLSRTNLSLGGYSSVNFGGSSLINSNLAYSRFGGANFIGADLRCTEFGGVHDIAPAQLVLARSLRFIQHLTPEVANSDPIKLKIAFDPP
jgi:uncharacterized protein YjbI with pentapeptide repeats